EPFEALQGQREVGTPLRPGDRMDLIEDDRLDAPERLPGRTRQEEVQALGRRDEDVRWTAGELAPVLLRRVARPAGDRDPGLRLAEPVRAERDAMQRGAKVAFD